MYVRFSTIPIVHINIITYFLFTLCDAYCPQRFWWDQTKDSCIECSICDENTIVLRPCQPHKDTVCGTLNDIEFEFDWLQAAQKQVAVPDWKHVSFFFFLFLYSFH